MNKLLNHFPVAGISSLPTPIVPLPNLGKKFGHSNLFMKRDDLSGSIYGGNKIRKLEFLLGEALAEGRKSVITYGAVGSNHALATAICCQQLGLRVISILTPQQTNAHVRKNILMQHAVGAELHFVPDYTHLPDATESISKHRTAIDGIAPYIIPPGGTNATGALGFVNAALEMAEQIQPDVIYLPMGTGGTLAGLLVGLKLAGLPTRVEAIRVVDPAFRNETHVKALCDELENIIQRRGAETAEQNIKMKSLRSPRLCVDKPIDRVKESDIIIRNEFYGEDYGIPTPAGRDAVQLFQTLENVSLETTYTGKCTAALLHDLRSGALDGQTVLYWNTLNSRDFSEEIANIDPHALPPEFHSYFAC